jgi:PBSX family phage terminase large subunit
VVADGAIRSGKTQSAGRLFLETAVAQPAVYLVARSTYRSLKDSTQQAMLFGDGALPPLIPPEVIDRYSVTDEVVKLRTGAEILFRSLEEGQVSKLLNLTLAGIFVDQLEELDGGDAGERVFDTLLGRLSDPRGPRKLLAVMNPAGLTSWQYRRLVDEATRDADVRRVHFTLRDNASNLLADYVAKMEATRLTRSAWYRSFILGEWGSFEGQAYEEFEDAVHVVEPFQIPATWEVFASLDHGASNPTAHHMWAADHDGNLVVFREYYRPGLVSAHAPAILADHGGRDVVCWSDPSVWANHGHTNKWGEPASIATEYYEHGLHLVRANNDRAAGYMRVLELLHIDPARVPPPWASVRDGVEGAPRLYVFRTCRQLVAQLKSAPVAVDGVNAGECVDPKWESERGHAHASLRYGAMSRPGPAPKPVEEPADWVAFRKRELLVRHERRAERDYERGRFVW